MAITKIWKIKGPINRLIKYIKNPDKTEGEVLVSGLNCTPKNAVREMNAVKRHFGKMDGSTAYHGIQSFAPGEVTPDIAHEIGMKLAERLWGERYQVLVTTHTDKESHIHNHFAVNTVSYVDGIKYHRTEQDYRDMVRESDQLCYEYGLSIIDEPEKKAQHYSEWSAEKDGRPTYRKMIKCDLDEAVSCSLTDKEFFDHLKKKGYEFKLYTDDHKKLKRPSLKPRGANRFFRFDSLGYDYQLDELLYAVAGNMKRKVPVPEARFQERNKYRQDHPPKTKHKGFAALYYYYCYELHIIQRFPECTQVITAQMREDLQKLKQLDEQTRFLAEHNIETVADFDAVHQETLSSLAEKDDQRRKLRNRLKVAQRNNETDIINDLKLNISGLTSDIKKLRKADHICNAVKERNETIRANLELVVNQNNGSEISSENIDSQQKSKLQRNAITR